MGKLGKLLVFTAIVTVLIGIGMVAVQGHGSLYISQIDLSYLARVNKVQIQKLRDLVKGDLTHEYMLEDAFLLKWLLEKKFEVKDAAELLKQNLEWRTAQNIKSILDENWNDMHFNFPYSRDTIDKLGRPLLYFDIGQWDITKLISEGQTGTERLERYFYKLLEESEQHIRDLQAEGGNVTQFGLIVNVDDFSLEKHGCLQCFQFYRNIGQNLAPNYPWATERISFVNVPYLFEMAYSYLTDQNKRSINILGKEQSIWERTLLETIDKNQIPRGLLEQKSQSI